MVKQGKLLKLCPSCGKKDGDVAFAGSFCVDCFSERSRLYELPKSFELRECSRCGRAFLAGLWREYSEDDLKEWLCSKIKSQAALRSSSLSLHRVKTGMAGELEMVFDSEGASVVKRPSIFISVDRNLCEDCHKRSGGYHEAVVQVRGSNMERVRTLASRLMAECKRSSFVGGIEEKKEGIDFLVGTKRAAMSVVSRLGMEYSVAHKLIGVKQGKRVHRITICIRI